MSKINLDEVISWENNKGTILCPECFEDEFDGEYPVDWTPVISSGECERIYQCDCCTERSIN